MDNMTTNDKKAKTPATKGYAFYAEGKEWTANYLFDGKVLASNGKESKVFEGRDTALPMKGPRRADKIEEADVPTLASTSMPLCYRFRDGDILKVVAETGNQFVGMDAAGALKVLAKRDWALIKNNSFFAQKPAA